MKKYNLLLHIGLPKTATTSFQVNVLQSLHEDSKINYFDIPKYHINRATLNPLNIRGKLSIKDINTLQQEVEVLLSKDRLNVVSNENLSTTRINKNVFYNLTQVFNNCNIKLLVSIRSPVDMLFSNYVQSFPNRFFWHRHKNTFNKYSQDFIINHHSQEYLEFMYEDYLQVIDCFFNNKTVLLFEDLKSDKESYFSSLAACLNIDKNEISERFLTKHQNIKIKTRSSSESDSASLKQFLWGVVGPLRIPIVRLIWRFFLSLSAYIPIQRPKKHNYPDAKLSQKLLNIMSIKDIDNFCQQHGVSKSKIIEYGYTPKK
jgi:hypothetical protein